MPYVWRQRKPARAPIFGLCSRQGRCHTSGMTNGTPSRKPTKLGFFCIVILLALVGWIVVGLLVLLGAQVWDLALDAVRALWP